MVCLLTEYEYESRRSDYDQRDRDYDVDRAERYRRTSPISLIVFIGVYYKCISVQVKCTNYGWEIIALTIAINVLIFQTINFFSCKIKLIVHAVE